MMAGDPGDLPQQMAEQNAEVAAQLARAARSRHLAAALGPVEQYPLRLQWHPTDFGLLVESDGAMCLLPYDAPILPGHHISRLIRPEFQMGIAGSC